MSKVLLEEVTEVNKQQNQVYGYFNVHIYFSATNNENDLPICSPKKLENKKNFITVMNIPVISESAKPSDQNLKCDAVLCQKSPDVIIKTKKARPKFLSGTIHPQFAIVFRMGAKKHKNKESPF